MYVAKLEPYQRPGTIKGSRSTRVLFQTKTRLLKKRKVAQYPAITFANTDPMLVVKPGKDSFYENNF